MDNIKDKKKRAKAIEGALREYRDTKKNLDGDYREGNIEQTEYKEKAGEVNEKIKKLSEEKNLIYEQEKTRLTNMLDELDDKYKTGSISEENHSEHRTEIKKRIYKIDSILHDTNKKTWDYHRENMGGPQPTEELRHDDNSTVRGSPLTPTLTLVLYPLAFIALIRVVLILLLAIISPLSILFLVFLGPAVISANTLITYIAGKLVSARDVSYYNSFIAALSNAVIVLSLEFIYGIAGLSSALSGSSLIASAGALPCLAAESGLHIWVYRSAFNTTWLKAFLVFLLSIVFWLITGVLLASLLSLSF